MATLKEEAQNYKPARALTIADLDIVSTDLQLHEEARETSDGEKFTKKFIIQDGEEYRVPNMVLEDIQTLLQGMPNLKFVKVTKTGEGKATRYKTIPITEQPGIKEIPVVVPEE